MTPLSSLRSGDERGCACDLEFEQGRLVLDGSDCDGRGVLEEAAGCRSTAIAALRNRDTDRIVTRAIGIERVYDDIGAALFDSAGRFVDRVSDRDRTLASVARRDPLRAAREATARAGPVSEAAAVSGLAVAANAIERYDSLRPQISPEIARSRVTLRPPPDATLLELRELDTGGSVRLYRHSGRRLYHLEPIEYGFDSTKQRVLTDAYDRYASGASGDGERAPERAAARAATASADRGAAVPPDAVETIGAVLRKYARGFGVLEDLFADDTISDVYATAPVERNPLRVVSDGQPMPTNAHLTEEGAAVVASRLRRASGRPFSRSNPVLDAVADVGEGVRVAAVTEPASDGPAFAFRVRDNRAWTLPALVANGTVRPDAAGLLSVAVERSAAILLAGARGAGKTTALGALLWELRDGVRVITIEDTPELPVGAYQDAGRDVQRLYASAEDDDNEPCPTDCLRTALRLGEGALVVGEVRGEEARVLYEAMRVGASDEAVLGTIHGDGGDEVRERVVSDLGVDPGSFASTDLVVTLRAEVGGRRRVALIEEIGRRSNGETIDELYSLDGDELVPTGRIDRGNSRLVGTLARPDETYADVLEAIERRTEALDALVRANRTSPEAVTEAYVRRRTAAGSSERPTGSSERSS